MDKKLRKQAQKKGIEAARAKGLYRGRQKGSVTFDLATAREKVAAMYAEADRQEKVGWGEYDKLVVPSAPRKRPRKYYRGGRTWDWWSWTIRQKKRIAAELGITFRTLRRHTDDLRTDEPNPVDAEFVLKDVLKRLPDDLLGDLGIEKTVTGRPSAKSMKAVRALLEVFRLASEWE
jgi:DNA invertase Pin-like site-specific DNA recombinase